jgi:hypothetical protein
MRQTLYESDELTIDFFIDESTDEAWVELETAEEGPDLSAEGDVVVAVAGSVAELEVESPQSARAFLGTWDQIGQEGLDLMIRVDEWFERWELE